MIHVDPMPEEITTGHEGRFGKWNACKTHWEVNVFIEKNGVRRSPWKPGERPVRSRLVSLAKQSGMSPEAYANKHSMLPIARVAGDSDVAYGDQSFSLMQDLEMRVPRSGAYCCLHCINEDLKREKFSWYRRSHHLVMMDWCTRHGSKLLRVEDRNPFFNAPHHWLAESKLIELEAPYEQLPKSGPLRRYAEIASALLQRERPFKTQDINHQIGNRARELGLCLPGPRPALLSNFVEAQFDQKWLSRIFISRTQGFKACDIVATTFQKDVSGHIYAICLAVLYESSEEALAAVSQSGLATQAATFGHSPRPDSPLARALSRFHNGQTLQSSCAAENVATTELENYLRLLTARYHIEKVGGAATTVRSPPPVRFGHEVAAGF